MWSPEREAEAPAGGDPAGLLPPEWEEDEERMSFLFSAFKRSREVNSTDWDSKMGFWAPLVLSHSRRQGVVRLRLRDLQEAFQRKGSVPLGLATVLQDLLRTFPLDWTLILPRMVSNSCTQAILPPQPPKVLRLQALSHCTWPTRLSEMAYSGNRFRSCLKQGTGETVVEEEKAEEVYRLYQNSPLSSHPVVALSELSTLCANSCPDERT
ncbi:charged multivesicular body protein 7, partial [Homo sapiens]